MLFLPDENANTPHSYLENLSNRIVTDEMLYDAMRSLVSTRNDASRIKRFFSSAVENNVISNYTKNINCMLHSLLRSFENTVEHDRYIVHNADKNTYLIGIEIIPGIPFYKSISAEAALAIDANPSVIEYGDTSYHKVELDFCHKLQSVMDTVHAFVRGDEIILIAKQGKKKENRPRSIKNLDVAKFPRLDVPEYFVIPFDDSLNPMTSDIRMFSAFDPNRKAVKRYPYDTPPFESWFLDEIIPDDIENIKTAIEAGQNLLDRHDVMLRNKCKRMLLVKTWHGMEIFDWSLETFKNQPMPLDEDKVAEQALLFDGTPYYDFD